MDITACAPPCRMRAGGQANTGGMPPSCGVGLYYWVASGRRCGAGQLSAGRLQKAEDSPRLHNKSPQDPTIKQKNRKGV